nr:reverse transcriptase domain-containing protein [Pantoea sp. Taur]
MKDVDPFCISLQETHLKLSDKFTLKGFDIFRKDSPNSDRAFRGVAVAIKQSVYSKHVEIDTPLQVVAVTVHCGITFTVCNIYLPQDNSIQIEHLLHIHKQLPKPVLYTGDFNGHNTIWGCKNVNGRGRMIECFIDSSDLLILNTGEPTFLSSTYRTYSAIDLSLCSPSLFQIIDWTVLPDPYSSDHFPLQLKLSNIFDNDNRKPRWIFEKADWSLFSALANPPPTSASNLSVENGCKAITEAILLAAESSIPKTKGFPKKTYVPWFSKDCKEAIKSRRKSFNKFRKNMNIANFIEYKKERSKCRRTLNSSKKESWKSFVDSINSSTPTNIVWNKIRKIKGIYSNTRYTLLSDGKLSDNPEVVGNMFATYYSEIYNEPAANVNNEQFDFTTDDTSLVYNIPFTMWELLSVLRNVKGSSPGPDNIHYTMIQHLPNITLTWLLNYYNHIWQCGDIPSSWLKSEVVPILKTGQDKRYPSSYRPIFLTSCLCKIMERVVNQRLKWILEKNNYIQNFQSGFRKGRSTIDHLVQLEAELQYTFVQEEQAVAVFFDMHKAFDKTNKSIILKKLKSLGFRGNLPIFIQKFLAHRHFKIRIGNTLSSDCEQINGVPQGCVLSTTLFTLAINDLGTNLPRGVRVMLFVDDLAIFYRSNDISCIKEKLQTSLNRINLWSHNSGLQFSTNKTKCVHFSRRRNTPQSPELLLNGIALPYVTSCRFLGLEFDRRLSWEEHIRTLKEKCLGKLGILKVLSGTCWGADRTSMLKIYQALICSKIDYGSFIYGSARGHNLARLNSIHHTGIRIATGAFRTSPSLSLCVESGLPPLSSRRNKLVINYLSRLYPQTTHPAHRYIFKHRFSTKFQQKINATLPLAERVTFIINHLKSINVKTIENNTPPWTYKKPQLYLQLSRSTKENTSTSDYRKRFEKIISSLPEHQLIFTDGSKSDSSTASAFVTSDSTHKFKLHQLCSVYTAEVNAIAMALQHSMNLPIKNVTLVSDSLSALKSLENMYSNHPGIQRILEIEKMMTENNKSIHYIWVPGHIGIKGNEMADKAAKDALALPGRGKNLLTPSELARPLKERIYMEWQKIWEDSPPSKLKGIKSSVKPWQTSIRGSRREEVVLTRLRIGHSKITHLHLITKEEPPRCEYCNNSLTVAHIFEQCPFYRRKLQQKNITNSVSTALGNDINNVNAVMSLFVKLEIYKHI